MPDNINYIDILLALPLAWAAFRGFRKGLVLSIASMVGLIAGVYVAIKFSDFVAAHLNEFLEISKQWLGILSFVLTFIGVVFLVHLAGKLLEKTLRLASLGFANRLAGSIFSLLKTALVLSFLLFLFHQFDSTFSFLSAETKESSLLYQPIRKIAPNVLPVIKSLELPNLDG